jgi:hypothetical protein
MTHPATRGCHNGGAHTRPALDAWLQAAERLLADQHNHSISPSLVPIGGAAERRSAVPLCRLAAGLPDLLDRLVSDPGRWILILEVGPPAANRFVQYLAYEDGSLAAETVSNRYLADRHRHSERTHRLLRSLGWWPPSETKPNWWSMQATMEPDVQAAARLGVATLRSAYAVAEDGGVKVRLFSSPRRGGTPLGPTG